MPRDGSNIYTQPFPPVEADTPIESAVYNAFTADVAQDLNHPRPILSGGTGATNARDAMIAMSGEIAGQVVDNYDAFPFVSGSFYSLPGATGAPDAVHYFTGICYVGPVGIINLEARLATGNPAALGPVYVKAKDGTGWSAWKLQVGDAADLDTYYDGRYVNVAGDVMSGNLTIRPATGQATLNFDPTEAAQQAVTAYSQSGVFKFVVGKQTNNSFMIYDVTLADYVLSTSADGLVTTFGKIANFAKNLNVAGALTANSGIIDGNFNVGNYLTTLRQAFSASLDGNGANLDAALLGGIYQGNSCTNGPVNAIYELEVQPSNGDPNYLIQKFTTYSPVRTWTRSRVGGTWQPWVEWSPHTRRLIWKDAPYAPGLADAGNVIIGSSGTGADIYIYLQVDAAMPFPDGTQIDLVRWDAVGMYVLPQAGVSLGSVDDKRRLGKPYSTATLLKVAPNAWVLTGNLAAV